MVIAVVVVAAIVAVLTLVPFPHSFTATLSSSISADGVQVFTFPKGVQVTGTWSTIDAVAVTFTVFDANGNVVYEGNASYGQFAFQANGSAYSFDASSYSPETTTVSGSYSSVIWALASV